MTRTPTLLAFVKKVAADPTLPYVLRGEAQRLIERERERNLERVRNYRLRSLEGQR